MKKFKNIPNKAYNIDGKIVWESRSCAVVGIIIVENADKYYVLINKRGSGVSDYKGKWCNCCGYIDFNENGSEAVIREVYEEANLDLVNIISSNQIIVNNIYYPYFINTEPTENRQNISLFYGLVFRSNELPKLSKENCEINEVEEVIWCPLPEIHNYEFAFHHDKIIVEYLKKVLHE